ncbi:putative transcriptional regulator [Paenimyroides aquimaris]|uniref:Putative transcriptional regulator n=1 Tax=Paenimyroides marinum TaxID=1159016 RepID=A0A1H6IY05_9FLAO|nr:YqgE/AlgH family protein [Paenimyroides aquimaris]SEH54072.1 putative transcriptional regulator [Paenimyroides aquimaris]
MKKLQPTKGKLLISDSSILLDTVFSRAVLLLAEHNAKGSVGFILNKPLDLSLQDILPEARTNFRIYDGGPVETDNLYFIHTIPSLIPNSIEIKDRIFWGGDYEVLFELLKQNKVSQKDIRFFLGYSGWDENQLQEEINAKSWTCIENQFENNLLEKTPSKLWRELMIELGDEFIIWANAPEDPVMN